MRLLDLGKKVLKIEEQAISAARKTLGKSFLKALEILKETSGRVIVIGMGKSGLIGRKLAATLTSTGTTAIFMHPAEALHGDLGLVSVGDAVLALSFSGETEELRRLLPHLKSLAVPIVAITGSLKSRLARASNVAIILPVKKEACPYNVTPTASTTAMLAVGDALAMALMEAKGINKEKFARLHPGGALGRRLNFKAKDVMRKGKNNPIVRERTLVREALLVMTKTRTGAANVVDGRGVLVGFFTDGDLRRRINQNGVSVLEKPVSEVMTKNPTTVALDTPLEVLARLFKSKSFDNLPVVDKQGRPIGLVDERDLL